MLRKAYLEITNVCNLRCAFCPGTGREPRFLTPEEFRVLAGKLRGHTEYLYFHLMGEPLLHPELKALLAIADELRFKVMLTTNGTLLPERQELLLASPALHKLNVSLQSFEANAGGELESYLRGCTDFAAAAAKAGTEQALEHHDLLHPNTAGHLRMAYALAYQLLGYPACF